MARNVSDLINSGKAGIRRRVIIEYIQRIFASVKSALASLDFSVMRKCLSDFELIATALHVLVKSLKGCNDFSRRILLC